MFNVLEIRNRKAVNLSCIGHNILRIFCMEFTNSSSNISKYRLQKHYNVIHFLVQIFFTEIKQYIPRSCFAYEWHYMGYKGIYIYIYIDHYQILYFIPVVGNY